jgi:glutamine amidotransferase
MGKPIVIIDYGAGNLRSVLNAIRWLGHTPELTSDAHAVVNAPLVILPGVGAAADTMQSLCAKGLDSAIRERVAADRPFFGVCIGLQVLFSRTEEGGGDCLGVIPGQVKRLPGGQKVPHMGWNQVWPRAAHPIFNGIPDGTDFYFVHSYYGAPDDDAMTAAETDYGLRFASAVARGNLVATQFHPERSGEPGLKIYDNFIKSFGT